MAPQAPPVPPAFREALRTLGGAAVRSDVALVETPAPTRIAPYAVAVDGEVSVEDADATGRLVVLHDPAGQDAWEGVFRVVAMVKAAVEPEVGTDELAAEVAWSWLDDALEGVECHAVGGTVTTTASRSFGDLAERPQQVTLEMRASWTPEDPDMGPHVRAWAELMARCAGIPPLPEGVSAMPGRSL